MKQQKKNEKFDKKLRVESLVKSTLAGIGAGALISFIMAAVSWFYDFNGLLIGFAVFAVSAFIGGLVAYKTVFHPTAIRNARRLDRYGLDERLVTMVELEGDDSYIAKKQREDAVASLNKLDKKKVKLKIPAIVISLSLVFMVLFVGMSTIEGLSESGILPSGVELLNRWFPADPPNEYEIVYLAGEGGTLIGITEQTVIEGNASERVLAVADEGYMFYAWDDGKTAPSRVDDNVSGDQEVTALFVLVDDDGAGSDDEDAPDDVPGDQENPMDTVDPNQEGASRYVEVNQVIDGETYFRDAYEDYYNAMQQTLEGVDLPADIKAMIEAYFEIVK